MASPPRASLCTFGYSYAAQAESWFDVRVFYVRVTHCHTEELAAPESLTMRFPPRDIAVCLELNGARIPPSEEAALALRRNRAADDPEGADSSSTLIYVSTDNLRTSATVEFHITDRDTPLVSGELERRDDAAGPLAGPPPPLRPCGKMEWAMDTVCEVGAHGCAFVKARLHEYATAKHVSSLSMASAAMEVCVVGTFMREPVILAQTVQLTARRRAAASRATLNAIPEDDEVDKVSCVNVPTLNFAGQRCGEGELFLGLADMTDNEKMAAEFGTFPAFDGSLYLSDSDPEETWYNRGISKGIKLGLGIGLGVCVGIGIGLGLIIRTYRTTSKNLNRGLV